MRFNFSLVIAVIVLFISAASAKQEVMPYKLRLAARLGELRRAAEAKRNFETAGLSATFIAKLKRLQAAKANNKLKRTHRLRVEN